jgi:hypothetical protein
MKTAIWHLALLAAVSALPAWSARAQSPYLAQPRDVFEMKSSANTQRFVKGRGPMAATIENGRVCTTIDFEGVGDQAPVPAIAGINTPQWLGIIDFDAGGTGNFAQEPSPETVAFWLGGNVSSRDIVLDNKASKVEFFYASAVTVTMQAIDDAGAILSQVSGAPNFRGGAGDPTGDYNRWDPLRVEAPGNKIKRVRVFGNSNQTGIDNLKVCTTIGIEGVEVTQAIQQYQNISDLKTSLQTGREAPVPVVAGKPAVVRVYLNKVDNVTNVRVQLVGAINETKNLALQPQCAAEDQRRKRNGCQSIDFYFTPPEGNWDLKANVLDSSGAVIDTHDLPFKSRKTDALVVKAVSICDAKDAAGNWLCEPANSLATKLGVLRKIAPTSSVTVTVTNNIVRQDVATFASVDNWWPAAIRDVNNLYGLLDGIGDLFGTRTMYYGMIRPVLPGGTGGMAHAIPGRGAGSRSSTTRLGVETVNETVAHEIGHTLGLRHTNTDVPVAAGSPPGCYNLAVDSSTDWPFANNRIQSAARLEVGFDVAARRPLDPDNTFDILSYCVPRWISPLRYKSALTTLGGGAVSSPSVANRDATTISKMSKLRVPAAASGPAYWTVSGTIVGGAVQFDPLFDDATAAPAGAGVGSYRVEVQAANGAVLASRLFTPVVPHAESAVGDLSGPASFFELLPVLVGAARIVVLDPSNVSIGTVALTGVKPAVSVTQPAGGVVSGVQPITWVVNDADSASHSAKVYYSPDNGSTWSQIGQQSGPRTLAVDFNALPGAAGTALVMVSVSDGVNSASAVSAPFSVPKHGPSDVKILSPQANEFFPAGSSVQLEAAAYDVDDGMLEGAALSWESSLGGFLGNGSQLVTNRLLRGTQLITLTATDRDGNAASSTTTVHVAGAPPTLDLTVLGLDTLPTTCVEATVDLRAEPGGVALKSAEYSLNGGVNWTSIPLNRLPFKVLVPGSGFVHFVARGYDLADQSVAKDAKFIINTVCDQGGTPRLAGSVGAQGTASPGVIYVDVKIANNGLGIAKAGKINAVRLRTLSGAGVVDYNTALSPSLPIALPDLPIGQSTTVRLYFNVPLGVKRFSITEDGSLQDKFGRSLSFSASQSVIP